MLFFFSLVSGVAIGIVSLLCFKVIRKALEDPSGVEVLPSSPKQNSPKKRKTSKELKPLNETNIVTPSSSSPTEEDTFINSAGDKKEEVEVVEI